MANSEIIASMAIKHYFESKPLVEVITLDKSTTTNVVEKIILTEEHSSLSEEQLSPIVLTEEQLSPLLRREEEAIVLTDEQEQALSELLEFVNDSDPDNNERILCGPAGVGKSVVASQFIIKLIEEQRSFKIVAPTHKAASVIAKYIDEAVSVEDDPFAVQPEVITLAKYLGKVPTICDRTGRKLFQQNKYLKEQHTADIIIFEECSMIGDRDLECIRDKYEDNTKAIFLGDHYQLPAVGGGITPAVFEKNIPTSLLTTTLRYYNESAIGMMTNSIRTKYNEQLYGIPWGKVAQWAASKPDVFVYSTPSRFKEELVQAMEDNDWVNNKDSVRALCYTNSDVDRTNSYVRQNYFGIDSTGYQPNDHMIALAPFVRLPIIGKEDEYSSLEAQCSSNPKDFIHILSNCEEFELIEKLGTHKFTYDNTYKSLRYEEWQCSTEDSTFTARLLHYKSRGTLNTILSDLKDEALSHPAGSKARNRAWSKRYKLEECFDNASFSYCMTIHKSQGSSIDNVFVNLGFINNVYSKPIRRALVYTALTRVRSNLHIYIPPQHLGTNTKYTVENTDC